MMQYSIQDIQSIYSQLVKLAQKVTTKKQWLNALNYIEAAAQWAYNFNWIYSDDELERLIGVIADNNIKKVDITNPYSNRVVLIDSFCMDNRGLTQQYLRAMMHNGMEIMYICTSDNIRNGDNIIQELKDYSNAKLLLFSGMDNNQFSKSKQINENIDNFKPAHIFLHILPWDTSALMTCHTVKGSCVYNVNLTDHAYWLGASLIDYNLEFRPYGMTVSLEKRGLKPEQLLYLPFYSIKPVRQAFQGFPQMPHNAVKILTGGSMYKILGDNDIFFHIMEMLLSISDDAYILIAGFESNRIFDEKCNRIRCKDRILQIGIRADIDAVFEKCDIYLGTYPTSGGLMTHYAARHGKPILAYHHEEDMENAVEELLNHYQNTYKSFTDLSQMRAYAEKLISDLDYRKKEGEILKNGLITEKSFYELFVNSIVYHQSRFIWNKDIIDYKSFCNRYLELENVNNFLATKSLLRRLKQKSFLINGYRIFFSLIFFMMSIRKVNRVIRS